MLITKLEKIIFELNNQLQNNVKILNFWFFEGYLYSVNSCSKTIYDYEITNSRTTLFYAES